METTTTEYGRVYNEARQAQGFKSQVHLDAFFAYYDHAKTCPNCQGMTGVALDDGFQPVQILCGDGERLYSVYAKR